MKDALNEWKYRRLKLRELAEGLLSKGGINSHPRVIMGLFFVSLLILSVAVFSLFFFRGSDIPLHASSMAWFYDLNTGDIFPVSAKTLPPVSTSSGPTAEGTPAGVRAYMFVQRDPNGLGEPFVGYLETRAKGISDRQYRQAKEHRGSDWGQGILVRAMDDEIWHPLNSSKGHQISMKYWLPSDAPYPVIAYEPPEE